MLKITEKVGGVVRIGSAVVYIERISNAGKRVRLHIDAPKHVLIARTPHVEDELAHIPAVRSGNHTIVNGARMPVREALERFGGRRTGWALVPEHMRGQVQDYFLNGAPLCGFLRFVFENDFVRAFSAADEINASRMSDYATFLRNYAPVDSWGSVAKVSAWCGGALERT